MFVLSAEPRIEVIRALCEHVGIAPADCPEFFSEIPVPVFDGLEMAVARRIERSLLEAGVVPGLVRVETERRVCVDPRDPARGDQPIHRVLRIGSRVVEERGPLGAQGEVSEQDMRSDLAAEKEFERRLDTSRARGMIVVADEAEGLAKVSAWNEEIEDLARAGSDGDDAVVADWLQEQRDPRGKLASVQIALESRNGDQELLDEERAILELHNAHLLGELSRYGKDLELTWRRGAIEGVRLCARRRTRCRGPVGRDIIVPETFLDTLLRLPAAARLRRLELESFPAAAIAELGIRAPRTLREIVLGPASESARQPVIAHTANWPR